MATLAVAGLVSALGVAALGFGVLVPTLAAAGVVAVVAQYFVPPRRRAFVTGLLAAGVASGAVIAGVGVTALGGARAGI